MKTLLSFLTLFFLGSILQAQNNIPESPKIEIDPATPHITLYHLHVLKPLDHLMIHQPFDINDAISHHPYDLIEIEPISGIRPEIPLVPIEPADTSSQIYKYFRDLREKRNE